jgi:hypothetical protein
MSCIFPVYYFKQIMEDKLIFMSSESKVYEMSKGHLSWLPEMPLFGVHETFLLFITFTVCSEDGGNKFLQKIGLFLPANMALHSSRQYSSRICFVHVELSWHICRSCCQNSWLAQKKILSLLIFRVDSCSFDIAALNTTTKWPYHTPMLGRMY